MSSLNFPAIHAAYKEHQSKMGNVTPPPPQPQAVHPMHAMAVHAMSLANTEPGENHQTMLIRALTDHLKRITPNVADIHKQPAAQP
jgi:hypothetical protein